MGLFPVHCNQQC